MGEVSTFVNGDIAEWQTTETINEVRASDFWLALFYLTQSSLIKD
jgi:hypothetical protein